MATTVIGLMDSIGEAQSVARDLVNAGIAREDIDVLASHRLAIPGTAALNESEGGDATAAGTVVGAGSDAVIGGLTLLGVTEAHARQYAESLGSGRVLVAVAAASNAQGNTVVGILKRHNAAGVERPVAA